jgi:hypothetical protein
VQPLGAVSEQAPRHAGALAPHSVNCPSEPQVRSPVHSPPEEVRSQGCGEVTTAQKPPSEFRHTPLLGTHNSMLTPLTSSVRQL